MNTCRHCAIAIVALLPAVPGTGIAGSADHMTPVIMTPSEFGAVLASDLARWTKVVKEGKISID